MTSLFIIRRPEYEALRKKVWEMTGFEKVNPKLSLEKALNKYDQMEN